MAPLCMKTMEVPDEILYQSLAYTRIIFSGLVLSLVYNLGAGILRAVGDSKTPFYILVSAGAVNIILDLIFVAVCKMNASGAALATIISCISPLSWGAITIAFALYYWHCGSTVFRKQKPLQQ